MRLRVLCALTLGFFLGNAPQAHHSFAMFDQDKLLALSGSVKEWQWTNPHTWLILLVKNANGTVEEWGLEGQHPQVLRKELGLNRDILKPGDQVIVTIHPRRDGTHGGSLVRVKTADGVDHAFYVRPR